mgnify:CR=1 FL=1
MAHRKLDRPREQAHAELDLDMAHVTRVQSTLQQLAPSRFHGMEGQLPDDGANTDKVRELMYEEGYNAKTVRTVIHSSMPFS